MLQLFWCTLIQANNVPAHPVATSSGANSPGGNGEFWLQGDDIVAASFDPLCFFCPTVNSLNRPSSARSLLVLVLLAMVLHFAARMAFVHPVKDRFDFSSALCVSGGTSGSTNVAESAANVGASSGSGQQDHTGHGDCPLCCGGNALVFYFHEHVLPVLPLAPVRQRLVSEALPSSLSTWSPQAARAPPQNT